MAGDLGYDPSLSVLETDALADYANPHGTPPGIRTQIAPQSRALCRV